MRWLMVLIWVLDGAVQAEAEPAHADKVQEEGRVVSRKTGRGWAVRYDLTGLKGGEVLQHVMEDWKRLQNAVCSREDPFNLHHEGRPLVAVWGIGFDDAGGA
jgi:hypothetical protein